MKIDLAMSHEPIPDEEYERLLEALFHIAGFAAHHARERIKKAIDVKDDEQANFETQRVLKAGAILIPALAGAWAGWIKDSDKRREAMAEIMHALNHDSLPLQTAWADRLNVALGQCHLASIGKGH